MTSFLSDADAWRCVCAARLAELQGSTDLLTNTACDNIARALQGDAAYSAMDPMAAAAAYLQGRATRAA